jgi:hypothetical protein
MLSLFRSRAGSSALRLLPTSSCLSHALPSSLSSSCVPSRSMFMHFTEEERAEQEDLVLADSSSHSSSSGGGSSRSSSPSSSHQPSSSASLASVHAVARASEPSDVVKQRLRADDYTGDNTQDVLNAAGYTQQHILHTIHADHAERELELHH